MNLHLDLELVLLRVGLAVVLGGLLGLEREWRNKPAGLRTHMMVSLGSATFCLVGLHFYDSLVVSGVDSTSMDPTRLVQGIVGGIGFLGAGVILRDGGNVKGLTTAGSLWLAGALGMAAGFGEYRVAAVAVVFALVVLQVVGYLESRVRSESRSD